MLTRKKEKVSERRAREDRRNRFLTILIVALAVVLAVLLGLNEYQESVAQKAREAKAAEARTYELEIEQIKSDLETMSEEVWENSDSARIMVGYRISEADEADLDAIAEQANAYGFSPVLVLDCTDDLEEIKECIDLSSDRGWNYMLTGTSFSDELYAAIENVASYLEEKGHTQCGVFLLRMSEYSDDVIEQLQSDGFIGYTAYTDTPKEGVDEDGMVYFDYSYLQGYSSSLSSRLSWLCANKSSMIVVFDLTKIDEGSMTWEETEETLEVVQMYMDSEELVYTTPVDNIDTILEMMRTGEQKQVEYEEYVSEQQERLNELSELIDEIYASD